MITNEVINEIRNKVNIVDIISNYVPLTKKGKNYFGLCPFHDDHSPSMSVSFEKQIYTCFVCHATGNVFSFVSEYEHIGFYDAVRLIGSKLGYNLDTKKKEITNNQDLEIYELACKYYQNSLNTSLGNNAIDYLTKRKIDRNTISKFRIGLSMSKSSLTEFLLSKNIKLDKLISLGISNERGQDLFINRIMFPLYDLSGNVVAFSGRIYNTHDESKYINTKETNIFKKGNLLYNYHLAKEHLKRSESIIVMEGFMDVIRASVVGINNCVATMGTAFTKEQALLLKKTTNNIILCFDGDNAGDEATDKAIQVLKEIDVTPRIIRLEENLDPDEYILKYGKEKFISKIDNTISVVEYRMNRYKKDKNLKDIKDISEYIDLTIKELSNSKDNILVELTLKKLSKEFDIEYVTLKEKLETFKKEEKNVPNKIEHINNIKRRDKYSNAGRHLLYYMIKDEKILTLVEEKVPYFNEQEVRILSNEIIYYYHKYGTINEADFISYISTKDELNKVFKEIINMNLKDSYSKEEINDYINLVNSCPKKMKIESLNKMLKEETDPLKQANILSDIMKLKGVGND